MDYNLTLFKGSVEEILLSHNGIPSNNNTNANSNTDNNINNPSVLNASNSLRRE